MFKSQGNVNLLAFSSSSYYEGNGYKMFDNYLLNLWSIDFAIRTFGDFIAVADCPNPQFPLGVPHNTGYPAPTIFDVFSPKRDLELCSLDILLLQILAPSGQFEFAIYESAIIDGEYRRLKFH